MENNNLKHRVLALLANTSDSVTEKYNKAFQLYRESEQKDVNQERIFNLGFTEINLQNVLYDLQKINGVSDLEVANAKMEAVDAIDQGQDEGDEHQVKDEAKKIANINNIEADAEVIEENKDKKENEAVKEEFVPAPTSDERAKLRDDFPFLNDANCPDELKVLVADKITAYKNYVRAQNTLRKQSNGEIVLDDEHLKTVTKIAVENFELNQEIYEELNYYKDNGKILGNHPIFKALTLQREVDEMSTEECFKYLNSSKKFISVKQTALEELIAKKPKGYQAKMTELTSAIEARKEKVSLVKKHQGISE